MAIGEPMDQLCDSRGDRPNMEFPHVETADAVFAALAHPAHYFA
jgi:hypothetical protein